MNYQFILIQIIGIIAWILLALSYYRKNTNKILIFHVGANILFCIHYFLLSAYSGLLICFFELIRDYLYYKFDKDDYVFLGSIVVYAVCGIFTFTKWLDIFPYVASVIDGFCLTKKKKVVIIGSIMTYLMWLIYDIWVVSISGIITSGILLISNIFILIFNIDLLDKSFTENTLRR